MSIAKRAALGVPCEIPYASTSNRRYKIVLGNVNQGTLGDTGLTLEIVEKIYRDSDGALCGFNMRVFGTPTQLGTFTGSCPYTIYNDEGKATSFSEAVTIVVGLPPTITTTSLPDGTKGAAYSQTVEAVGDTPITWSIVGGELPPGLSLNASTGVISGTVGA